MLEAAARRSAEDLPERTERIEVRSKTAVTGFVAALCIVASPSFAHAQALPTATASRLYVFAGVNGTYTGLRGSDTRAEGRNAGITAGLDIGLRTFFHLEPAIEARGTYPFAEGAVDSQRNLLVGLQVSRRLGRLHPYGDILFGRGEVDYLNGGYPSLTGDFRYTKSTSYVICPGLGVNVDVARHFAIKVDGQLPRYVAPVTSSGSLYAKSGNVGIVYRIGRSSGL